MITSIGLFTNLVNEQAVWSDAAFGTPQEHSHKGCLDHLIKEANEAMDGDIEEFADCLLLVIDGARRAGHSFDALAAAAYDKLQVCKVKKWKKPTSPDQAIEHVKQ